MLPRSPLHRLLLVGLVLAAGGGGAWWGLARDAGHPLPRPTDLTTEPPRWVAGDMHMHSETSDGQSLAPEAFLEVMEQQGLDVGVVLVWGVRPEVTAPYFSGPGTDRISGERILHYDLEVSSFPGLLQFRAPGFGGAYPDHMIGLGLSSLSFPRRLFTYAITAWSLAQNAVTGVAHAGLWAPAQNELPLRHTAAPGDLPVCLALGQELFLSTEHVSGAGFYRLYYGLLNCGFRIPLCAGSDWPVTTGPAGTPRTHVWLSGGLSYQGWIEGLRAGRTTISSNATDRVNLFVDGRPVGDRLDLPAARSVTVVASYQLAQPADLELIANGRVVVTRHAIGTGTTSVQLEVEDSAWLAVRTLTTHSGPIYLDVAGRPIRSSVKDAVYFRAYVDALMTQLRSPTVVWDLSRADATEKALIDAERLVALELCQQACTVWDRTIAEARARPSLLGSEP